MRIEYIFYLFVYNQTSLSNILRSLPKWSGIGKHFDFLLLADRRIRDIS